jgi:Zn-dependent protease with chaperone function
MDFFSAQDRTRSTTRKLIFIYIIAIIALNTSIYFVTLFIFGVAGDTGISSLWIPELFIGVSFVTFSVIAIGTISRVYQLKKGGSAVAEMLGGRKVCMSTTNTNERRLINVVEEMSIAAGIPVPDLYILDQEPSINAFAAGYSTRDAAIGVTRGTLEQLNRDELQGVIAHEFSHIFNGDMRINIRLIGILNGILLIHLMGLMIMRSGAYARLGSGGRNKNQGGIIVFGIALLAIGYIGMLFGRIIQSAVSRQREYLADAAAVQYTRNPDGLAGALHKISASIEKPTLNDAHAMEMSHLFFASSFKSGLDSLFATHPPIQKRIKALGSALSQEDALRRSASINPTSNQSESQDSDDDHDFMDPKLILAAMGTIESQQISKARGILDGLSQPVKDAVHEPLGAEALIFAMLLSGDLEVETNQIEQIRRVCGPETEFAVLSIKNHVNGINPESKLPVVEIAIPALKEMSETQFKRFRNTITSLISADGKVSLFEYALEKIITHQLEAVYSNVADPKITHTNLSKLGGEISLLISAIAHETTKNPEDAWNAAIQTLDEKPKAGWNFVKQTECTFDAVDQALEELGKSSGAVKKAFLNAALHSIALDGRSNRNEMEWIRAMAAAIDSPLPLM